MQTNARGGQVRTRYAQENGPGEIIHGPGPDEENRDLRFDKQFGEEGYIVSNGDLLVHLAFPFGGAPVR